MIYWLVTVPDGYNAANIIAQAFRGIAILYGPSPNEGLLPISRWGKTDDVGKAVVAIAEEYRSYAVEERM